MKLLIIDDEKSIRNTLKDILEFEGHEVHLASDGVEGLAMATSDNYEVIFSDIKMPNMDGMELLDKLSEANVDSSVVMISGHGSIDTAVECIKRGHLILFRSRLTLTEY